MISPELFDTILYWSAVTALLIANALCVFMVALQLPGTWIMLGLTGLMAWWRWEDGMIGWWALASLLVLAGIGELLELAGGSLGAAKAGSTRWGAFGALIGGVFGAIIGTFLMPIPIIGTLVGACVGAAAGSMLGNWDSGMRGEELLNAAKGAAWGKFWGTLAKLGIAVAMWLVAAAAIVWP